MIKKIMLASCFLVASMASQAALISYNGYERDTAKNIVTGGGLEWLKWDVTKGMSVRSALESYSPHGWRLASHVEMASLFNSFEFGKTDWDDRSSAQYSILPWNVAESSSAHYRFNTLFGLAYLSSCQSDGENDCALPSDPSSYSAAHYGNYSTEYGRYSLAQISDDYTWASYSFIDRNDHVARWDGPQFGVSPWTSANAGVALVRNTATQSNEVPAPGSIVLLALGLVALGYRRRHVLGS